MNGREGWGFPTTLPGAAVRKGSWTAAPDHGTEAAYKAHHAAGEPVCYECQDAHADHRAALYVAGRMLARHPNRLKQRTELAELLDALGLLDTLRDTP